MSEKKGVLIYYKYRPMLELLTREEQGDILMAILEFDELGTSREMATITSRLLWMVIQEDINALKVSWEERVNQNTENGRKGGRPRNNPEKPRNNPEEPTETQTKPRPNPEKPRPNQEKPRNNPEEPTETQTEPRPNPEKAYKDNDNDKDKDKENEYTHEEFVREDSQNPPMQNHRYPKGLDMRTVLATWERVPGAPSPGDLYRFQARHGRDLLPLLDGLEAKDYIAAIKNYATIRASPDTWWEANPDILTWTRKHLDRFLPANFKPEEYKKDDGDGIDWDRYMNPKEVIA